MAQSLIIPNLALLGVPRRVPAEDPQPDLVTIWMNPWPVLTNYKRLCHKVGLVPFTGGSYLKQGKRENGYITSGYRNELINENVNSPHRFGIALDFIVDNIDLMIEVLREAVPSGFTRVGCYPERKFVHVDIAPDDWIEKFSKSRFWLYTNEYEYLSYNELQDALINMLKKK